MGNARLRDHLEAWLARAESGVMDPATEAAAARQALAELPHIPTQPEPMCPGCED
jgi:hypothetical protein